MKVYLQDEVVESVAARVIPNEVAEKMGNEQIAMFLLKGVNAFEIVQCKDCTNYNDQNGFCHYYLKPEDKDGYCSHGERREK